MADPRPSSPDRWVLTVRPAAGAPRITLICLPHAGGSPDLFRSWARLLRDDVELLAIRLPGRGIRLRERLYDNWPALIEDTYAAVGPYLNRPHAFYGHSFGARLGYELTRLAGASRPGRTRRLFVSACRSPDHPQHRPFFHRLPDPELVGSLRTLGGSPVEVLEAPAMRRVWLPVVRSEVRLAETWSDRHGGTSMAIPITGTYGSDDPIDDAASMRGWSSYSGDSELVQFPGGHFHPETHREALLKVINSRLEDSWVRR